MKKLLRRMLISLAMLASVVGTAQAAVIFVGSWNVDDGPTWTTNPLAYSGVGAANLLFGPGTYEISTVDNNPLNINNQAWYSIIGVGDATFAENYFRGTEGVTHYQDVYIFDPNLDTVSTYVNDFGGVHLNYAFRVEAIPEPATLALLGLGLAGLGFSRRKQ